MSFVQRRLLKGVLAVVARPRLTLIIAGILLAASILLAWTRLSVSTDQDKLFSSKVQFFKDWLYFNDKFPENDALYVLIEPTDPARTPPVEKWTLLADQIAQRLHSMPGTSVDYRVPLDRLALSRQSLLFAAPGELKQDFTDTVQQMAPLAQLVAQAPESRLPLLGNAERAMTPNPMARLLVGFQLGQPNAEQAGLMRLLADGWIDALRHPDRPLKLGEQIPDLNAQGASDPSRLGYYYEPDESDKTGRRHLLLIRVNYKEDLSSLGRTAEPVEAIRAACKTIAASFPQFTVGITGRPAIDADEMRITDRDSNRAETIAMIAIFIGLVLMFRSIWLALVAEIALAVGIGWTFGYATLAVGELNLLSLVFIIALIGIGMDYLVQILMRYRVEARRYVRPAAVWVRVFRYVSPPIFTACLGAAGAFFVAVFTNFRGAAELGIIAGGGLLLCLAAGYTVLPALLVIFPPKLKPYAPWNRYKAPPRPRSVFRRLALPAVWVALLAAGIPFARQTQFNSSLLDLQSPNLESVKLIKKLQTWTAVVLCKDLSTLAEARRAILQARTVASTESILDAQDNLDWLQAHRNQVPQIRWETPVPLNTTDLRALGDEARALAAHFDPSGATTGDLHDAAVSLRQFADVLTSAGKDSVQAAARLSGCQEIFVAQLRRMMDQLTPSELNIQAVPAELRTHLVSGQGDQSVYALYVNPKKDLWDRNDLRQFVEEVTHRVAKVPSRPPVTGIAVEFYEITQAVQKSFYKATLYALALIFVLVLVDLRNLKQTLLAISVLAVGLPMLIVLMGLMGVNWNFANFFGLPILIGAGHEYGVFMVHRYKEAIDDPRRVWRVWDASDRALLLCAFVTSSSFGFFWWMSDHVGLKSLGFVMALGSACIYLATVMVLRPLLMLRLESLRRRQAALEDSRGVETLTSSP